MNEACRVRFVRQWKFLPLSRNAPSHKSTFVQQILVRRPVVWINHPRTGRFCPPGEFSISEVKIKDEGAAVRVDREIEETIEKEKLNIKCLDPASPFFEDYGIGVHLYKDDADYVDVVHTNAYFLVYGGLGIKKPIGHVDYFPNGGKKQPGCGIIIVEPLIALFITRAATIYY